MGSRYGEKMLDRTRKMVLKGDFRVVEVRVIESTSNFTFSMTFIKESYRNIKYTLFKSLKLVIFYWID